MVNVMNFIKLRLCLAFSLLFLIYGISFADINKKSRPEVADVIKAWEGTQGEQVWTLRYGRKEEHKSLVQINNIDHAWNKKIHLMSTEEKNGGTRYYTHINNEKHVILITNQYSGELYLPDEKNVIHLQFDKELSSEGNPQHFLTDYLNIKAKIK
ncbi:hypothetical protein CYE34_004312 [Salmonella enterica subsp. enterica serovar Oranienburg]|nr:hypothetical protein [Salmonella enterica subsp. enterica serovar Oranienburg]